MHGLRLHPFDEVRPGNAAMYYPEANAIVGRTSDPASKTPAFKCVVVTIEVEQGATSPRRVPAAALASAPNG
jgi:hypothetical protein